jgi:SLBB domain-containing protein
MRGIPRTRVYGWLGLLAWVLPAASGAQQRPDFVQPANPPSGSDYTTPQRGSEYMLGAEQRLQMVVYIIGEVQRPGEYSVPDNTNVLELLSKAGGGTILADMSEVTITHQVEQPEMALAAHPGAATATDGSAGGTTVTTNRVIKLNLDEFLRNGSDQPLPALRPGDVIKVPKNSVNTWRNVSAVLRDLALVASTYFVYLRVK